MNSRIWKKKKCNIFMMMDGIANLWIQQRMSKLLLVMEMLVKLKKWMIDGMMFEILFHNSKAIGVEVPQVVELKIVETPPNFKGDTQGGKKSATLESGAVVQIPFHVLEGETIRVDTVRGEYIERAGK